MSQKTGTDEIEATRQVGLVADYDVEFACFVERRPGNKRRIRYEVRIDGWPSSTSFFVEDDRAHPALGDAEIEAACAYIRRFLREGITDGIEVLLREAHHLTHGKGWLSEKAFLKAVSDYVKDASEQRLRSDVPKRTRRDWQRFQATATVHRDMAFFKEYRAEYKRLHRKHNRTTHQRSDTEFVKKVWREHERTAFTGQSPEYLELALRVAHAIKGGLTPKRAALEWASRVLRVSPDTVERHYLYRRKKKPAKTSPK